MDRFFLNPNAGLALFVGLPLVGGLIVLLYVLKLRRRDVIVSSTFLWRQVIRDAQANAPFQKLRKNLLLFLQLLLACLLAFALARPFQRAQSVGGRSIVLIVDTGASMRAADVAPSRLEAAKREAQQIINGMGSGDRMLLVSAYSRPQAVTGFTDERAELRHAVDSLPPHDTPTNMRDALNLSAELASSRDGSEAGQIELVSDGSFENAAANKDKAGRETYALSGLHLGKTPVKFHPVGMGHDNVGIIAVDFRRSLSGEKTGQVLVVTHNYAAQSKMFNEEISVADNLLDAHEITLPPNSEKTETFDVPEPDKAVTLRVRLDIRDDLSVDNEAALIVRPRRQLNVLLVGTDNLWLENALRVDAGITLSKAAAYPADRAKDFDVIVFNEMAPPHLPEGCYLFLHCLSDQCPASAKGQMDGVGFADVERDHPVMRYVDFGSENLLGVYKAAPLDWGRELAVGDSGSLVVAGEKNRMRAEFVAFSLEKSVHFLLTVPFPIFIANSVRWLGTGENEAEGQQAHTGATVAIPAAPNGERLTVTLPDGSRREIAPGEQGQSAFDGAEQAGVYTVEGQGIAPYHFAANLANPAASDITPHKTLALVENASPASNRKVETKREWLPTLASLALLLLAVEWYVFHRRIHLN